VEYGVVVELDGQQFHPAEDVQSDNERDNAVVEAGNASLRFGWKAVTQTACQTAIRVARVLRNNGWDGKVQACSVHCPVRNERI
jgi:very-short-patch-repair endonuclease